MQNGLSKNYFFSIFAFLIFFYAIYQLHFILMPFFVAFLGAYILQGSLNKTTRFFKISRSFASIIITLLVVITFSLLTVTLLPYINHQFFLLLQKLPKVAEYFYQFVSPLLDMAGPYFGPDQVEETLKTQVSNHVGGITRWVISLLLQIVSNSMILANIASLTILTPIILYYFLRDWPKMIHMIYRWIPPHYVQKVHLYSKILDNKLRSYGKGQSLVCLILMILYTIGLYFTGLKQALFVGLISGFLGFIPFLGALIGFFMAMIFALSQFSDPFSIFIVAGVFISIGTLEGNILAPRLIGEKIGVHPVWIIFILLASGTLLGLFGVVLSLPFAVILSVMMQAIWHWYKETPFYSLDKLQETQ